MLYYIVLVTMLCGLILGICFGLNYALLYQIETYYTTLNYMLHCLPRYICYILILYEM